MKAMKIPVILIIFLHFQSCLLNNNDTIYADENLSITIVETQKFIDESEENVLLLIDVRTESEYNEGHINGAINIDFYNSDFKETISQLDRDVHYIIYCRSGSRSFAALKIFMQLGFTNVQHMQGGIIEWEKHGFPLFD